MILAALLFRLGETVSLASCFLNVWFGTGDREVTLSAGSWELRLNGSTRLVRGYGAALSTYIDALHFWEAEHCRHAWIAHAPIWAKVANDRGRA